MQNLCMHAEMIIAMFICQKCEQALYMREREVVTVSHSNADSFLSYMCVIIEVQCSG